MRLRVYHGSGSLFGEFQQTAARMKDDYYGGGVGYFTDSLSVAKQYAKAMTKLAKVKNPDAKEVVYLVELQLKKLFDIDESFTGRELTKFISNTEDFARKSGMFKLGVGFDKYDILFRLKNGDMALTGDEIFKGISGGMSETAKAREKLKRLGYDGLRYNGGDVTNTWTTSTKHNVYIPYYANNIKILSVQQ